MFTVKRKKEDVNDSVSHPATKRFRPGATKDITVAVPTQDTPRIMKNKLMRAAAVEASGSRRQQRRRSSIGLRGKRVSCIGATEDGVNGMESNISLLFWKSLWFIHYSFFFLRCSSRSRKSSGILPSNRCRTIRPSENAPINDLVCQEGN